MFLAAVRSKIQRYLGAGLALFSIALTGCAALIWLERSAPPLAVAADSSDARAWNWLERALRADEDRSFSARVQTTVFVGDSGLQSEARLMRAPQHLAVTYLSGPMRGQQCGFSQRWFWRSDSSGTLTPYAETAVTPGAMARGRFDLMRKNYAACLQSPQVLDGRNVEVVELRPRQPLEGARGPARRVFIDARSGLTLRTESFNSRLQPVAHSTLSDLNFNPQITPATFAVPANIAAAAQQSFWQGEELGQDARAVALKVGIEPPQSQKLPRGFALDGFGVHRCQRSVPGQMQVAAFTRYSDGLGVLTLFAVKTTPVLPGQTAAAALELNCSYGPGTVISRADGAGTLVAMGDLPTPLLRRVLSDAHFRPLPSAPPAR